MDKMEIWLVILFLSRKKCHAKQICVLSSAMKLGPGLIRDEDVGHDELVFVQIIKPCFRGGGWDNCIQNIVFWGVCKCNWVGVEPSLIITTYLLKSTFMGSAIRRHWAANIYILKTKITTCSCFSFYTTLPTPK